jgi:transposase
MLKRHEIQVLRRAGHNQCEVAKFAGVSERSVRRVEDEEPVASVDDAGERQRRRIGRPAKAEAFRQFAVDLLAAEPTLLSLEVLRRARLSGYAGGKSALYALIASIRPRPVRPVVRFEGLPGEFSQHDFGQVDVRYIDGGKERVHFFASRLKYSRWVEVTVVPDERVEPLVRTLVDHFAAFGGIPLMAVFDRPKTIAQSWRKDGTVTEWNATFGAVTLDLGLGVELCWPHSGNQKGSVENLVGWVKGSFFKQRRFVDKADLLEQLAAWQVEVNTKVVSRATGVVPALRRAEELPRLRPLKVTPDNLALRYPVMVGPTGYVLFETRHYSMHPESIGIAGTLSLSRDKVRIVAGSFEATHDRLIEPHTRSTLPEHRLALVAAVSGKRGKRYLKRQQILDVGGPALYYLTEITHRRPREWTYEVDQLHELLQTHGQEVLRAAFAQAIVAHTIGIEYVRRCVRAIQGDRGGGPQGSPPQQSPDVHVTIQQELPL